MMPKKLKTDWDAAYADLERQMDALGVRVRFKSDSKLHRLIGILLWPVNRRYMTSFITTLGKDVWWPGERWDRSDPQVRFRVMAHELQHVLDRVDHPWGFPIGYVMPQALAVLSFLALGAFWSLQWLWALLALTALIPGIMPTARAHWEIRGYRHGLVLHSLEVGDIHSGYLDWAVRVFTGPAYYWMSNDKGFVEEQLRSAAKFALLEENTGQKWLDDVTSLVRKHSS
jgi:hypothetical protein